MPPIGVVLLPLESAVAVCGGSITRNASLRSQKARAVLSEVVSVTPGSTMRLNTASLSSGVSCAMTDV